MKIQSKFLYPYNKRVFSLISRVQLEKWSMIYGPKPGKRYTSNVKRTTELACSDQKLFNSRLAHVTRALILLMHGTSVDCD